MCGIIGISEGSNDSLISEGMKVLLHRGPDDKGLFSNKSATLGHCRLSIIDLSPLGHQPMQYGDYTISFNGEIYNYKKLRTNLIKKGVEFMGSSDTEVILRGYTKEGKSFFKKMRGMWALAIYDMGKKEIILCRDHFGIKPLYYVLKNNLLYFASEIKVLKKIVGSFTPNTERYFEFYNLGYFIGDDTCYKEVKKVLPGEVITWNINKRSLFKEMLLLETGVKNENMTFEEAVQVVEDAITDSIEKHYVADVEVGLLLSGGNDSSLIAALSKKIGKIPTCYHMSIPGSYDTGYAGKVVDYLGLRLVQTQFDEKSLYDEYVGMRNWIDLPTSDVSIIPTALVYRSINKGSKVVLSGEGGDELFGGYLRHQKLLTLNTISSSFDLLNAFYVPSNFGLNFTAPIIRRMQEKLSRNIIDTYLHNVKTIGFPIEAKKIKDTLSSFYNGHAYKNLTAKNLFFDHTLYLPDSLMYKNDIASMISSIEARVPLVDKEVLSATYLIPDKFKLSSEYSNKKILKTILKKYFPAEWVDRSKKGFGFSFDQFDALFFTDDYKKAARFHLDNARVFGVNDDLCKLLSESNANTIIKKFPRFAFSIITNHMVMG